MDCFELVVNESKTDERVRFCSVIDILFELCHECLEYIRVVWRGVDAGHSVSDVYCNVSPAHVCFEDGTADCFQQFFVDAMLFF